MIYHVNGGFNWGDVYSMPINLREFYFAQLLKIKDTETKNYEKANNAAKNKSTPSKTIRR